MCERIILLAEDDPEDANAIRDALTGAGVTNRVIRVFDGGEAIDYLKGVDAFADRHNYPFPAILLLDLKMPRVDGFQVLAWMKENLVAGELPVIVFSGFDDLPKIKRTYDLGATSFLTKPCAVEDIRNLARAHQRVWNRLVEPELAQS